jgi:hypothetical protein
MQNKVDVCINIYGKPWQTLCTLKSLMKHSGYIIDKIYAIIEKSQPYNENVDWIFKHFDNVIKYTPSQYIFFKTSVDNNLEEDRLSVRYQYGFEKSDKKYIFITHNDVLYTEDIIGNMLENIGDSIGIGEIGQCWNCPAKEANLCSGEKFYEWNPTYNEIISLKLPHIRTNINNIDKINPKPLPECRLNEWACLVNKELSNKETYPNGDTPFFGTYGMDVADIWFKSLHLKGYTFKDYRKSFIHTYWANGAGGYVIQSNESLYIKSEEVAKEYYENFLKAI